MPFIDYFQQCEMEAYQRGLKRGLLTCVRAALRLHLPEQEQTWMARAERLNNTDLIDQVLDAALTSDVELLTKLLP